MTNVERKAMQFRAKRLIKSNATNPHAIQNAVKSAQKNRDSIKLRAAS